MTRSTSPNPARRLLATGLLCLLLAGCGTAQYPVRGKVTLEDGTPVTKGLVIFESVDAPRFMARGTIESDGTYRLSTSKPGDGVPAGQYKVLINSLDLSDLPDEKKHLPYHFKYLRFETSELKFEVKAEENEIPIKLAKAPRAAN